MCGYITKEQALEIVKRTSGDYAQAFAEISRLPTIEERKEAYWKYDPDTWAWECTACGALWVFTADSPKENNANFCPVCGAIIVAEIDEKGRPWKCAES